MDITAYKIRAFERAIEQKVTVFQISHRPGYWRAHSVQTLGKVYDLEVVRGDVMVCSCPGFATWGCCKHAAAVMLKIREQQAIAACHARERAIREHELLLQLRLVDVAG